MGLYSNDMPEPGTDGFTFKIRQKLKQAIVSDININNPKKVQICKSIPIDDEKIQKIIDSGTYRDITKPTEIGGDADFDESVSNIEPTSSTKNLNNPDTNSDLPIKTSEQGTQSGGKKNTYLKRNKKYNIKWV
jgi:hypothetical protein